MRSASVPPVVGGAFGWNFEAAPSPPRGGSPFRRRGHYALINRPIARYRPPLLLRSLTGNETNRGRAPPVRSGAGRVPEIERSIRRRSGREGKGACQSRIFYARAVILV